MQLNPKEASEYVRLSIRSLARLRVTGLGPRFAKIGAKVIYRQTDLDAWIASKVRGSTGEVVR